MTSICYEKPQPVFGLQIIKIPNDFHGEFYKKNNQIITDQNNIADSSFYYHPKLTIGPTSIHWFKGLNRQIRRMCESLDYRVAKLKRVRIMNIKLDVPVGQWRYLNEDEIWMIQSMVADSTKEV